MKPTEPWVLQPDDPERCDRCGAKIKTGTATSLPRPLVPPSVRRRAPRQVIFTVCGWCKTYANRELQAETPTRNSP